MNTNWFLQFFVWLPVLGFFVSICLPARKERWISGTTFAMAGMHLVVSVFFILYWIILGCPEVNIKEIVVYSTKNYEFYIDFFFDKTTAVFLLVGSLLFFLVTSYSQVYLHREPGFKRFFNTIFFFFIGYNLTISSGNFETLFIGWEILGISSFLLIAFYRDRYLPVRNALKVFSIYRIGDIGILLAMWMSHHLWHESITFLKLENYDLVHHQLENHSFIGVFISLMILVSAAAKSAQLPFSSWLPRAMEGPTPSSAIFYGSLSVHIGVFLLLKTFPFWEHQISVRILIGLLGLSTAVVGTWIARVQSSAKSQIAYSSVSQIGLIFIEVALGWHYLALLHFAGNAFLRTYQLLVSPSVVSYQIREQFYTFVPRQKNFLTRIPKKIRYTIYVLSIKEWNLGRFMYKVYWQPLKYLGSHLQFIQVRWVLWLFVPLYSIGVYYSYDTIVLPHWIHHELMPLFFGVVGLLMVLKSFTERKRVQDGFTLIILNHFWIALAIAYNEFVEFEQMFIYLSGVVVAGIVGHICLYKLKSVERNINLDRFRGHVYEHPKMAFIFLLSCLGLAGFPITPTFIGEDLIFNHIHEDQAILAFIVSLSFISNGLSIMRLFAREFLGPHAKTYHELAYRSS